MSLKHILLGLLREPASGYDLKRQFDGSAAYFWHAELSQIYPTLKDLEEEGFLESESEASDRGPDRRVYRTTPAGREELRDWLRHAPRVGHQRLEHVAQLFFLGELDDPVASRSFLERFRAFQTERVETFRGIEEQLLGSTTWPEAMDPDPFHQYASVRLAGHVMEARIAWCDEILALLDRRAGTRPEPAPESIPEAELP